MPENNNEKVDPRFATQEELEELCLDEFVSEEELCECDCGDLLSFGFEGDYDDLLSILYNSEAEYINSKIEYEKQEVDLWLNTNFEEVMDKPKLTVKEKEMYVKQMLLPLKLARDSDKAHYEHFKRMYELSLKYSLEVLR